MLKLTRANDGGRVLINPKIVDLVEETVNGRTTIWFGGESIRVKEPVEIIERMMAEGTLA